MTDLYRTIENHSEGIYKEKGSKFLAFAYPVSSEEEISQYQADLRKQYHDARHHCYAWRLGPEKLVYRVNDDGEPSGSAGKPIFGQIQSRDLSDILVVVVRYFGGTLLGVGGLIRAYRSAASDALDHNSIIERRVFDKMKLDFAYVHMNSVMKLIKDLHLEFENQLFDLDCSLILRVWKRKSEQVLHEFSKIEGCKISLIEE
ncbi:MAG: YigZ family protein [Bacteroidia bacterium]|nr:MAG: YigZ family protein [Bacteroidia bacterium]